MDANTALDHLRAGNRRHLAGDTTLHPPGPTERESLAAGQSPFAAILACADSRVGPELLFDQNLGDLFVVRVAGNIATPTQIGSLEYTVAHLGTRLVVVLGHSGCGAIGATIDHLDTSADLTPGLASLVDHLRPVVQETQAADPNTDTLLTRAIEANVHATVRDLKISPILAATEGLHIVGAHADLATGSVTFFDGI